MISWFSENFDLHTQQIQFYVLNDFITLRINPYFIQTFCDQEITVSVAKQMYRISSSNIRQLINEQSHHRFDKNSIEIKGILHLPLIHSATAWYFKILGVHEIWLFTFCRSTHGFH